LKKLGIADTIADIKKKVKDDEVFRNLLDEIETRMFIHNKSPKKAKEDSGLKKGKGFDGLWMILYGDEKKGVDGDIYKCPLREYVWTRILIKDTGVIERSSPFIHEMTREVSRMVKENRSNQEISEFIQRQNLVWTYFFNAGFAKEERLRKSPILLTEEDREKGLTPSLGREYEYAFTNEQFDDLWRWGKPLKDLGLDILVTNPTRDKLLKKLGIAEIIADIKKKVKDDEVFRNLLDELLEPAGLSGWHKKDTALTVLDYMAIVSVAAEADSRLLMPEHKLENPIDAE
jgi:ribosome-associated protein YbcJ (S4-like RNA binding protein)